MKSKSDEVFISRKNFDLVKENDAIDFQREMYNLASMLESLIMKLDVEKCDELAAVKQDALGMQSFQTQSKKGRMDSITDEEDAQCSMDEDEDDLGVFDSDNVCFLAAGNRLNSLTDLDGHLWPLTTQLFEGVKFMHDHNVAHMDLKPANILVSTTYGRLTILDFGISVRLKNKTQLLEGYAGTKGYIAPEVGKTRFSPIHADLWSVGKVVKELCMLCRPSTSRDWLLDLSERQLLNDDPSKRPMMSEVLEWMLKLDASKT